MDQACESPVQFLRRTWWLWAGLLAGYAVVGANLPPLDDEVYYWTWSKTPQWSYYDHPGMTAWLIWLSTRVFGDTLLGLRFPAACCTTVTLFVIAYLTSPRPRLGGEGQRRGGERFEAAAKEEPTCQTDSQESSRVNSSPPHPSPLPRGGGEGTEQEQGGGEGTGHARGGGTRLSFLHPLMVGVLLTPLFTFGGILITPDAPLIACWALYLLWLVRLHEALGWHAPESAKGVGFDQLSRPSQSLRDVPPGSFWTWWLIGGVLLGLGGLSKYTMILAVPAGFVSFLLIPAWSFLPRFGGDGGLKPEEGVVLQPPLSLALSPEAGARGQSEAGIAWNTVAWNGIAWKPWFWGYLAHGVVSMIVASPIVIYNVQHNFEPLLFQWRHAMHDEPATFVTFAEFFGVQLLLFGTLPFYLAPWTARHLLCSSPLPRRGGEGTGRGGEHVTAPVNWFRSLTAWLRHNGSRETVSPLSLALSPGAGARGPSKHGAGARGQEFQFDLRSSSCLRVCSCLYLLPLMFFVYKAARTELEGNWGLVAFLSVWPVAGAWYETVRESRLWRWLTASSFLPPGIAVLGLSVLLLSPVSLLPPEIDRLNKQRSRWEMSRELADFIHARGEAIPVFSNTYQLTALLRFHGVDARQEGTSRPSHYTFPPESVTDFSTAYFVDEVTAGLHSRSLFRTETLLATFPTVVRGVIVQEYALWKSERMPGNSE